jgi:hypothetical protein
MVDETRPGGEPAPDLEAETATRTQQQAATAGISLEGPIEPMSVWVIALITLYLLLFTASASYTLIKIWPSAGEATPDTIGTSRDTSARARDTLRSTPAQVATCNCAPDTVTLFWARVHLDFVGREELRLVLIALLAGALGAFISTGMSFASYLGNKRLDRWWGLWYVLRPPIGMLLALLTYFLLRGGLLSPGASVSSVSPFGVAGIAGLVGMFVKEATDKLRDVARALFESKEDSKRSAPLNPAQPGPAGGTSPPPPPHNPDPGA